MPKQIPTLLSEIATKSPDKSYIIEKLINAVFEWNRILYYNSHGCCCVCGDINLKQLELYDFNVVCNTHSFLGNKCFIENEIKSLGFKVGRLSRFLTVEALDTRRQGSYQNPVWKIIKDMPAENKLISECLKSIADTIEYNLLYVCAVCGVGLSDEEIESNATLCSNKKIYVNNCCEKHQKEYCSNLMLNSGRTINSDVKIGIKNAYKYIEKTKAISECHNAQIYNENIVSAHSKQFTPYCSDCHSSPFDIGN